jgi:hypothetical protein
MTNGFDELRSLGEETIDYLQLRWASLRLTVVDKLSNTAAKALGVAVAMVFIFSALAFLALGLALWVGEMLGRPSLGFVIVGGAFLIIGIIVWFVGRRMFLNSMVRHFVDMFFTDNDYRHGM